MFSEKRFAKHQTLKCLKGKTWRIPFTLMSRWVSVVRQAQLMLFEFNFITKITKRNPSSVFADTSRWSRPEFWPQGQYLWKCGSLRLESLLYKCCCPFLSVFRNLNFVFCKVMLPVWRVNWSFIPAFSHLSFWLGFQVVKLNISSSKKNMLWKF